MNKPEKYILGVKEMKHLKELGLKLDDDDSLVYWVKFIQTQGKHKCHKWKKSLRSAKELNWRNPRFGHYIGMPAYTLQQIIELLDRYDAVWSCSTYVLPVILMNAYNNLCEILGKRRNDNDNNDNEEH